MYITILTDKGEKRIAHVCVRRPGTPSYYYDDRSDFYDEMWQMNEPQDPVDGQVLYYKDKYTGEIKSGVVSNVRRIKDWPELFDFTFEGRCVRLSSTIIGSRLFGRPGLAKKYGETVNH